MQIPCHAVDVHLAVGSSTTTSSSKKAVDVVTCTRHCHRGSIASLSAAMAHVWRL
jgi:hypothetical protein